MTIRAGFTLLYRKAGLDREHALATLRPAGCHAVVGEGRDVVALEFSRNDIGEYAVRAATHAVEKALPGARFQGLRWFMSPR